MAGIATFPPPPDPYTPTPRFCNWVPLASSTLRLTQTTQHFPKLPPICYTHPATQLHFVLSPSLDPPSGGLFSPSLCI